MFLINFIVLPANLLLYTLSQFFLWVITNTFFFSFVRSFRLFNLRSRNLKLWRNNCNRWHLLGEGMGAGAEWHGNWEILISFTSPSPPLNSGFTTAVKSLIGHLTKLDIHIPKFNEPYKEKAILYLCYLYSQTSTVQTCEDWAEWSGKSRV